MIKRRKGKISQKMFDNVKLFLSNGFIPKDISQITSISTATIFYIKKVNTLDEYCKLRDSYKIPKKEPITKNYSTSYSPIPSPAPGKLIYAPTIPPISTCKSCTSGKHWFIVNHYIVLGRTWNSKTVKVKVCAFCRIADDSSVMRSEYEYLDKQ